MFLPSRDRQGAVHTRFSPDSFRIDRSPVPNPESAKDGDWLRCPKPAYALHASNTAPPARGQRCLPGLSFQGRPFAVPAAGIAFDEVE
jgi:hypothetical protein